MAIHVYLEEKNRQINAALACYLPAEDILPSKIHQAMRYSVFAGGKRLRPCLAIAAFEALGGSGDAILPAACAIELIHTYSLIHDDLPAMDNDDLRRGKPTNHKVFGEAMAILAGDALLTFAFELAARTAEFGAFYAACTPQIITRIARSAGTLGMIGGQVLDLEGEQKRPDIAEIDTIHHLKTAKLIALPMAIGALLAGCRDDHVDRIEQAGLKLGLAFQIVDDVLDVVGGDAQFGKPVGSDQERHKSTYPAAIGLERSRQIADNLIHEVQVALAALPGNWAVLVALAEFVVKRQH